MKNFPRAVEFISGALRFSNGSINLGHCFMLMFVVLVAFCKQSRTVLSGTNQWYCGTGKQSLSRRVIPRIGREFGRSSTMAQASSAVKQETENAPDDSLEAAVKGWYELPINSETDILAPFAA